MLLDRLVLSSCLAQMPHRTTARPATMEARAFVTVFLRPTFSCPSASSTQPHTAIATPLTRVEPESPVVSDAAAAYRRPTLRWRCSCKSRSERTSCLQTEATGSGGKCMCPAHNKDGKGALATAGVFTGGSVALCSSQREDGAGAVDEEEEEPDQPAFGPEDTSDEALAWRLMQEEQQQFNARLMNMARAQFGELPLLRGLTRGERDRRPLNCFPSLPALDALCPDSLAAVRCALAEGAQQEEEEYGDEAEDGDAVDDPLANAPDVENMTYEVRYP